MKLLCCKFAIVMSVIISCTSTNLAFGSLLLEPHLGYNVHGSASYSGGTATLLTGANAPIAASTDKYNGFQYGARAGFQFWPGIMLGLDYNLSNYTDESKDSSGTTKDDYKRSEIGAFAGILLPLNIRVWYGYYIAKETITKDNAANLSYKGDYLSGNSSEIGVGYAVINFLSLNLMYRLINYGEGYTNTVGIFHLRPKFTTKEIVLGLSAPITFF
jgi:opacity protein-like surface antigen